MNLVIDIGNTRTKLSLFQEGVLQELIIRASVSDFDIPENWKKLAKRAIISSVSRNAVELANRLPDTLWPKIVLGPATPLPARVYYDTPETLGTDRISAAIGASVLHPGKPALIINAGTALTIDETDSSGHFLGGRISPGIQMRFRALHTFTEKLPLIENTGKLPGIGKTTTGAIQAGVLQGIIYEVEGYIHTFEKKHSSPVVLITGGDSEFFAKYLKNTIFVLPNLVLIGLDRILEYNAKTQ